MGPDRMRLSGRWFRVTAHVPAEVEDSVIGLLSLAGSEGLQSHPAGPGRVQLEAWFAGSEQAAAAAEHLAALEGVQLPADAVEPIEDDGWLERCLQPAEPLRVGPFLIVEQADAVATRQQADAVATRQQADAIELIVPRSRAFGTGAHETTSMCLELLSRHMRAGMHVLDLGAGSAILAIAAARLGAVQVLALDNDPQTLDVAEENLQLNGVEKLVRVAAGSWQSVREQSFDMILANIHKTATERAAPVLCNSLRPGGVALLSGFVTEDADPVARAWTKRGCRQIDHLTRAEWSALAMGKP